MIRVLLLFISLFLLGSSNAQFAHRGGDVKNDWLITGSSMVLFAGGQAIQRTVKPFEISDIEKLNSDQINSFDRIALDYWSPSLAKTSDILLIASPLLVASLFADSKIRADKSVVGHMAVQTVFFNLAVTDLMKSAVRRPRPFVYNDEVSMDHKIKSDARLSFFSGHTSTTASMSFFTATVFSGFYPESKAKGWVWAGAALYPAVTGYLRVRSGKHFPTDVITGYLTGALIGWLIPQIHSRQLIAPN